MPWLQEKDTNLLNRALYTDSISSSKKKIDKDLVKRKSELLVILPGLCLNKQISKLRLLMELQQ